MSGLRENLTSRSTGGSWRRNDRWRRGCAPTRDSWPPRTLMARHRASSLPYRNSIVAGTWSGWLGSLVILYGRALDLSSSDPGAGRSTLRSRGRKDRSEVASPYAPRKIQAAIAGPSRARVPARDGTGVADAWGEGAHRRDEMSNGTTARHG